MRQFEKHNIFRISNVETKAYSGWILPSERIIMNYNVDFLCRTGLSIYFPFTIDVNSGIYTKDYFLRFIVGNQILK